MKKTFKIILFIFLGLIAIGVVARALGGESPNKDSATAAPNSDSTEAKNKKDHTYTAVQLVSEYTQNEVRADENFKGKLFWVTGTVKSIGKDILNKPYITLSSDDIIRSVQCYITDTKALAALNQGVQVTIKGTCKGLMMNVLMQDCEIVPN